MAGHRDGARAVKHLASAPLPTIAATPDEDAWDEHVGDLLRQLDSPLERETPRIILRGGTAARLGHGLGRPSRDIDADMTEGLDIWALLEDAATRAGMIALAQPARRHRLKGRLMLAHPAMTTPAVIDVDVRELRDPQELRSLRQRTERRRGIWMYTAAELARQKIAMAVEPGRRRRAKDRFDIAWWLRTHIEHIPPQQRIALDHALRTDPGLRAAWDAQHASDETMNRVDARTVHDALTAALDRDPAVRAQREPEGRLRIEMSRQGTAQVLWTNPAAQRAPTALATFDNHAELETFMVRMGLWTPDQAREAFHATRDEQVEATSQSQRAGDTGRKHDPSAVVAKRLHALRAKHHDPAVRANAHLHLAALAPDAGSATQILDEALADDRAIAAEPTLGGALSERAAETKKAGHPIGREAAIAGLDDERTRAEARGAVDYKAPAPARRKSKKRVNEDDDTPGEL